MPKNTLKMRFLCVCEETRVRMQVAIYNSHVHLKYMNFYIATHVYLLVYAIVVSTTRVRLLKMSKNMNFEFWVVWVAMQLTPLVVTTLSSTLTLH